MRILLLLIAVVVLCACGPDRDATATAEAKAKAEERRRAEEWVDAALANAYRDAIIRYDDALGYVLDRCDEVFDGRVSRTNADMHLIIYLAVGDLEENMAHRLLPYELRKRLADLQDQDRENAYLYCQAFSRWFKAAIPSLEAILAEHHP